MMEVDEPPIFLASKKVEPSTKQIANVTIPWVEKYRPKKVEEVVYQEEVVSVLKNCLSGGDFPNLLFYGPPGTGKTSTILALAHQMFTGDLFKQRVLELNASDERGINVVREKIKQFAQQSASSKLSNGTKCPPLKLIILDEADSMTVAAQSALRRTMEKETKSTRFCLICNYVSRMIEPIASRCTKFRFKSLRQDLILGKLKDISVAEGVNFENDQAIDRVIKVADGDLRKGITILHTLFRLKKAVSGKGEASSERAAEPISLADVDEVAGFIPDSWLVKFTKLCQKGSIDEANIYINDLILEGYSGAQFLSQLGEWVLLAEKPDNLLDDNQKAIICEKLAEADHCLLDGANEFIQLLNIAILMIEVMRIK